MKNITPLEMLRQQAAKKLDDTASELGKAQQAYQNALSQQDMLRRYQEEYRKKMHSGLTGQGLKVHDLVVQNAFISSLHNVINQQKNHVQQCHKSVNHSLSAWRSDKQRLNAFETLKNRNDAALLLAENRRDQKLMDEFAQRISYGKKTL